MSLKAADTAPCTVIPDIDIIRVIPVEPQRSPQLRFNVAKPFPHNLALVSVLYLGERPEITPHEEEPNKAKTTKGNIEST